MSDYNLDLSMIGDGNVPGFRVADLKRRRYGRELLTTVAAAWAVVKDPKAQMQIFEVMRNFPAYDIMTVTTLKLPILQDPRFVELYQRRQLPDLTVPGLRRLAELPSGTLGHELAHFVLDRNMDARFLEYLFPPDNPSRYFVYRTAMLHDIQHYLTGYNPDDIYGEVEVDAFQWAQTGAANHTLFMIGGLANIAYKSPTLLPLALARARVAYERGLKVTPFFFVDWAEQFPRPVQDVCRDLGLETAPVPVPG